MKVKVEGVLSFITLKNHRLSPQASKQKKRCLILNIKMGRQKSIIAAMSVFLRRRLQPGLEQRPDLSGAVPALAAAGALLASRTLLPLWNVLPRREV